MKGTARLVDFAYVCVTALVVWIVAERLWPYLAVVAPIGALVTLLLAVNLIDALSFVIHHRRHSSRAHAAQEPAPQRYAVTSAAPGLPRAS